MVTTYNALKSIFYSLEYILQNYYSYLTHNHAVVVLYSHDELIVNPLTLRNDRHVSSP